jgi:predicted secreted protein
VATRRDQILNATHQAARVLNRFPVGSRTSFDIIRAVTELGIPLLFRPLKGLWGATVTTEPGARGVLVTTQRDLHVQRFTVAHELGHILLGHKTSLDETVGLLGRFADNSRPAEEVGADTFASELLAPRSLMLSAAQRHRWTKDALVDPKNVYQLSLRLGISFQATCWALAAQKILPEQLSRRLQEQPVKQLKLATAPESFLSNSWADVWNLTEGDSGSFLEAGPDDVFAVQLLDNASAGFLWELVSPGPYAHVLAEHINDLGIDYGQSSSRVVFLRFNVPGTHRLEFEHRRPWNKQKIAHIDISIDNCGKESGGLPRRARERALHAASA